MDLQDGRNGVRCNCSAVLGVETTGGNKLSVYQTQIEGSGYFNILKVYNPWGFSEIAIPVGSDPATAKLKWRENSRNTWTNIA